MKPDELNIPTARLYNRACALLRNRTIEEATAEFKLIVGNDPQLLTEVCRHYIEFVARDMGGKDLGAGHFVNEDHHRPAAPDGSGHQSIVDHSLHARPVTHARRGLADIASIQSTLAKSIFILPDGRDVRNIQWHELVKLAREYETAARLLRHIESYAQNVDPFAYIRDVVKDEYLERAVIFAKAAENAHV